MKLKITNSLNLDLEFNKIFNSLTNEEVQSWIFLVYNEYNLDEFKDITKEVFENYNNIDEIDRLNYKLGKLIKEHNELAVNYLKGLQFVLYGKDNKEGILEAANQLLIYTYLKTEDIKMTMDERLRQFILFNKINKV